VSIARSLRSTLAQPAARRGAANRGSWPRRQPVHARRGILRRARGGAPVRRRRHRDRPDPLGENVATLAEAESVQRHYLDALRDIRQAALPAQISVKLTQLG